MILERSQLGRVKIGTPGLLTQWRLYFPVTSFPSPNDYEGLALGKTVFRKKAEYTYH